MLKQSSSACARNLDACSHARLASVGLSLKWTGPTQICSGQNTMNAMSAMHIAEQSCINTLFKIR
jgi:hypothetical protein